MNVIVILNIIPFRRRRTFSSACAAHFSCRVPSVAQKRCLPICVLKTNGHFSANCTACSSVDFPETHRGVEFLTCAPRGLSVVLVNMAECNASVCVLIQPVRAEDCVRHLEPENKKAVEFPSQSGTSCDKQLKMQCRLAK